MNQALGLLPQVEIALKELATNHKPEGSTEKALIDQWLHALSSDSDLYRKKSLCEDTDEFKQQVLSLIQDRVGSLDSLDSIIKCVNSKSATFRFIDLFAGIGGVRLGFEAAKGVCVFSSEFDAKAQLTYKANHGDFPFGDITKITEEDSNNIPDHDVLLGGFPCQAFSIAGYRQGFDDEKGRGNLFLNIHEILKVKKPKAFLLENVKNLQGHDGGKTFKIIKTSLEELGYSVIHKVMNSMEYGNVPQTRERIYIVGFKDEVGSQPGDNTDTLTAKFKWPETEKLTKTIRTVLESNVDDQFYYEKYACHEKLAKEMTREDTVYQWRRHYVRENKSNVCPTLTANMGTGGHNVPLILDENRRIRKLTPRECSYVQGFPDSFVIPKGIANSHLYKQFGNSVTVPVIKKIALEIERLINL